jgi:hypothetical protein
MARPCAGAILSPGRGTIGSVCSCPVMSATHKTHQNIMARPCAGAILSPGRGTIGSVCSCPVMSAADKTHQNIMARPCAGAILSPGRGTIGSVCRRPVMSASCLAVAPAGIVPVVGMPAYKCVYASFSESLRTIYLCTTGL